MTSSTSGNLDWLLDDLVGRVPGVRFATLLSTDGLLLGRSAQTVREQAEHLSALASALHGLGRSAGTYFEIGGVQQTVIELDHGILFVTAAGANACLAVLTEESANMGMVAFEMNQTVQRARTFLSTPTRTPEIDGPAAAIHADRNLP